RTGSAGSATPGRGARRPRASHACPPGGWAGRAPHRRWEACGGWLAGTLPAHYPRRWWRRANIARVHGRTWLGIDVGGKRKGFDLALIDAHALLVLCGGLERDAVIGLIERERPALVAIDSPRGCAPP